MPSQKSYAIIPHPLPTYKHSIHNALLECGLAGIQRKTDASNTSYTEDVN